jgi:hypothetical protein
MPAPTFSPTLLFSPSLLMGDTGAATLPSWVAVQRADAAAFIAVAGVPVWTALIPEASGVKGVIDTVPEVEDDEGDLSHEGIAETITIVPGTLGNVGIGSTITARPVDAYGQAVTFKVHRGPVGVPPDGVFHELTVMRLRTVGA